MIIKNVNHYTISQLLETDSKMVYEIPKYQREYTWRTTHWENLFDDLCENQIGYFFGTIICIDTSTSINAPKREVVDGQQRLTTISLLLCALYSLIAEFKDELNEDQSLDFSSLKRKLVLKNTNTGIRVIPQSQNSNLEDYKGVLAQQSLISPSPMPRFAGNRRIKKAFEYFKNRINETAENNKQDKLITLFELLEKINSSILVMIEVYSHAAAYVLFESLNNRGTPLTAIDLMKNLLLAKLDTTGNGSDIDYYFSRWQTILNSIGDDYSVQERFFRYNYNAFRHSLNKPFVNTGENKHFPLGALAMKANLLGIYEKIITKDPHTFLDELTYNAEIYSRIICNSTDTTSPELFNAYQSLSRVKGAPSYLLLLYLEKYRKKLEIEDPDISAIADLMIAFFVRRNLTDIPPTRDLARIFMTIIDDIEDKNIKGGQILHAVKSRLISRLASDDVFEEKLRGAIYEENTDATRFILCKLAESNMTRETKVDLWERNTNGVYTWTIEHIFPQGNEIPKEWVAMIADGNEKKAKELQEQYVHTLGNLTLTGFNANLSNKPFTEKRDKKDKNGIYIGYKNGLILNQCIGKKDVWTVEEIKKRTDMLVSKVLDMFRL